MSLQAGLMAILGIEHVERNGHHYFKGLSMFPPAMQDTFLADHPDLYHRHPAGFVALDITKGRIRLASALKAPFGYNFILDTATFSPLDRWTFESLMQN